MSRIRSATLRSLRSVLVCCALAGCAGSSPEADQLHEIRVAGLRLDARTDAPIVELVETENAGRRLSIWIGEFEAQSIARAIEHAPVVRPNPHDLITDVLEKIEGRISRTLITELREGTYYAVIELRLGSRELAIDARPSDAIAVALRAGAPIFVHDALFAQSLEIPDDENALDIDWPATSPVSPAQPRT